MVNKNETIKLQDNLLPEHSDIVFTVSDNVEILKLCANGDIYVKGKLAENDKEVVNAMRSLITQSKCPNCSKTEDPLSQGMISESMFHD